MELNELIQRVAVLRAESRSADKVAREAADAANDIRQKLDDARDMLRRETQDQIDKLDPVPPNTD